MTTEEIKTLLREFDDTTDQQYKQSSAEIHQDHIGGSDEADSGSPETFQLQRSFASSYLDELIIAILFRYDEANGMDIIREFSHAFGVQFSPGTVYPHLHSLEEDGILVCRECVQTKEYSIDDEQAAREHLESTLRQLSSLIDFLATADREASGPT